MVDSVPDRLSKPGAGAYDASCPNELVNHQRGFDNSADRIPFDFMFNLLISHYHHSKSRERCPPVSRSRTMAMGPVPWPAPPRLHGRELPDHDFAQPTALIPDAVQDLTFNVVTTPTITRSSPSVRPVRAARASP